MDTSPCINAKDSYVMDNFTSITDVENSCRVELMVLSLLPARVGKNISFMDIHNDLAYGFEVSWSEIFCQICSGREFCFRDRGIDRPRGCSEGTKDLYLVSIFIILLVAESL